MVQTIFWLDFQAKKTSTLWLSRWCDIMVETVKSINGFLEELGLFELHWQILRRKSLPVVRLFFLYEPWRRGKSGTNDFLP